MAESLASTGTGPLTERGAVGPITVGRYNLRLDPEHGAVVSLLSPEDPPAPAPHLITSDAPPTPGTADVPLDEAAARERLAPLPDEEKRLLSALAVVGGGPVEGAHLAVLADVPDPRPALDGLMARQLVASQGPRYSVTGHLAALLPSLWDLSPWRERALAFFLPWAEARREDPAALLAEAAALRHLLDWAAEAGRGAEAIRLGRLLDGPLAMSGRWGAWALALERARAAAVAMGDRATEGWALHQLGTRLLCLEDRDGARPLLTRALAVRKSLGDRAGAEVTRHNLGLLPASAIGVIRIPPVSFRMLPWLAAVVLLVLVGAIRLASSRMGEPLQQRRQPAEPIASGVPAPSQQPGATPIPQEMTTDVPSTSDLEEATPPPLTTDHSAEGTGDATQLQARPDPPVIAPVPVFGWCCVYGEVSRSSQEDCEDGQGAFFRGQHQATAACLIVGCCVDGDFKLGDSRQRCDELGGEFMSAVEVPLRCKG